MTKQQSLDEASALFWADQSTGNTIQLLARIISLEDRVTQLEQTVAALTAPKAP